MNVLKISYRNIFRNWRRSLLTFSAIIICLTFTDYGLGLVDGMRNQILRTTRITNIGDIKIYKKGYEEEKDKMPLDINIENYDKIIDKMKTINEIEAVSPRIIFSMRIFYEGDEIICKGVGVIPELENEVFSRRENTVNGDYLEKGDEKILIGYDLANLVNIKQGNLVTIASRTKYGTITALDIPIKGRINTGNPEVDNFMVFFSLQKVNEFLEMENNVTEIVLKLNDYNESEKVKEKLSSILEDFNVEIFTWRDQLQDFIYMFQVRKDAVHILNVILFLMTAFVIANTMLMSVFERKKEIGTLMALGMKKFEIVKMILTEGLFIGLLGGIIGSITGGLCSYYFQEEGLSISFMKDSSLNLPFEDKIYGIFSMEIILTVFVIAVIVSVISSFYPAKKITKFQPAEIIDTSEV